MAKMTPEAREAFLAARHVGVLSVAEPGRGPLTVPIWYGYTPGGEVWVWTDRASRKAALLQAAGRASLCVQDEAPPYRYVSIEGPVTTIAPATPAAIRALAHRYLGAAEGDTFLASLGPEGPGETDILIHIRPERWLTMEQE
ncbi:MAG: TIGR03618 family F420-dependent PPOX class oxidoreductase [Chloroflexales bacterium]